MTEFIGECPNCKSVTRWKSPHFNEPLKHRIDCLICGCPDVLMKAQQMVIIEYVNDKAVIRGATKEEVKRKLEVIK